MMMNVLLFSLVDRSHIIILLQIIHLYIFYFRVRREVRKIEKICKLYPILCLLCSSRKAYQFSVVLDKNESKSHGSISFIDDW